MNKIWKAKFETLSFLIFLSIGFYERQLTPNYATLIFYSMVMAVKKLPSWVNLGWQVWILRVRQSQEILNLGISHKIGRAKFVMRVCRGCILLASQVPHWFVGGTLLARERQSYISRTSCSNAASLHRAFPDLRVSVAA